MKSRMTILAALFGLVILCVPAVASAHPMHPWRHAIAAQRFQSMRPRARFRFLRSHPFFARHERRFNRYAYGNQFMGPESYGRGRWGQRFGYMNQGPDGAAYGYGQQYPYGGYGQGDDGDADDAGYSGYGMPMGAYGYGNPYYGNNYGMLGSMLPMLEGYMH